MPKFKLWIELFWVSSRAIRSWFQKLLWNQCCDAAFSNFHIFHSAQVWRCFYGKRWPWQQVPPFSGSDCETDFAVCSFVSFSLLRFYASITWSFYVKLKRVSLSASVWLVGQGWKAIWQNLVWTHNRWRIKRELWFITLWMYIQFWGNSDFVHVFRELQ